MVFNTYQHIIEKGSKISREDVETLLYDQEEASYRTEHRRTVNGGQTIDTTPVKIVADSDEIREQYKKLEAQNSPGIFWQTIDKILGTGAGYQGSTQDGPFLYENKDTTYIGIGWRHGPTTDLDQDHHIDWEAGELDTDKLEQLYSHDADILVIELTEE